MVRYFKGNGFQDRDPDVGRRETQRRLEYLPQISDIIHETYAQYGIQVEITVIGSALAGLCLPGSDLDLRVSITSGADAYRWRFKEISDTLTTKLEQFPFRVHRQTM